MGLEAPTIIPLSDPAEQSINFVRVDGAVSRDFDGLLTCTVLFNGIPVAYMTHKDSSYGDAGHGMPGWCHILTDDPSQVQSYAHFLHWIGEVGDNFPAHVAEVLARPAKIKEPEPGQVHGTVITPWTFWDALDESDNEPLSSDRGIWTGDGHEWCGFGDAVDCAMYRAFPEEWPKPNEWYGEEL